MAIAAINSKYYNKYMELEDMQLSVKETAELLNKSQQFVRIGLQRGILPFGYAIQISGKKYTYHISKKKVYEYLGIEKEIA
jgi:hypothetical protein